MTWPATHGIALLAAGILMLGRLWVPAAAGDPPVIDPPTGLLFRALPDGSKFIVYVPRDYAADRAGGWPAVVFLHGKGECGTDGQRQAAVGLGPAALLNAGEWPAVILMPQKPDAQKQWEDYDDLVMKELAVVRSEWNIDPSRITLTGLSQGGHGTWTIGSRHTDVFAALAPICGYGDPTRIVDPLARAGTPVWAFHGQKDEAVNSELTQKLIDGLRSARATHDTKSPDPKFTLYPDLNHNSWDRAYRAEGLSKWLLEQRRK